MLRLLQSFFGRDDTRGTYPESLVKEAIERAVDGTDPWLRGVSGYRKKLRPAVLTAIDHVVALVDGLPAPLDVSPSRRDDDPRLKTFFISTAEMRKVINGDRNLAGFVHGDGGKTQRAIALLAMEKREGVMIGAELSGDIVMRDVPQVTVTFEAHRFIDPSGDERETRRQLKRRAYDHLLTLALKRIAIVKAEREDLERRRALLEAKLNLFQRGGWGFDETGPEGSLNVAGVEEQLKEIETDLLELGGDDKMLQVYLDIVADVLGRPAEHLWMEQETLIVDRLGIKRGEAASDAPEVTLDILYNTEGRSLVVTMVTLPVGELQP